MVTPSDPQMMFNLYAGKIETALDELLAAQDQAAFDGALINAMASFSGPPMPPK